MPKVSTLKAIYDNHVKAEKWLSTIPHEISDSFFDTPYINGLQENLNLMIKELFGIHADSVEWLLYEWREDLSCGIDGCIFDIKSPEEYYEYLIKYEGWEE